jgi:hypothetical protein
MAWQQPAPPTRPDNRQRFRIAIPSIFLELSTFSQKIMLPSFPSCPPTFIDKKANEACIS